MNGPCFKNFKDAYTVTLNPLYRDGDLKLVLNKIYPYILSIKSQPNKKFKTVYLKKESKLLYLHCGVSEGKHIKLKIGPSLKIKKTHAFPMRYDLRGWLIEVESTFDEGFIPSFSYDEAWDFAKFTLEFERFFLFSHYEASHPLALEEKND